MENRSVMERQEFKKLLADFPCLVPVDASMSAYAGFIRIKGKEFRIRLASDCSRFDADPDLKRILKPHSELLEDRFKLASSAREFLVEVRDMAERAMNKEAKNERLMAEDLPSALFYERLLNELSDVGWDFVAALGQSMRNVDIKVTDSADRCHIISLTLPSIYPQHPPRCVTGLPRPFKLDWGRDKTMKNVLQQFRRAVEKYQDFFWVMEDFDKSSCVLEPEHPTWRDTYRRIALDKHCSIRIEIDPNSPIKGFPECRFLGSETAVGRFKQSLNRNMHMWDTSGKTLPRENLERILEMQFSSPAAQRGDINDDISSACGICYAYRVEDRVPDVACDLPECAKPYHKDCLLEWLRVLPDTRESFGNVTGKCVYCDHTISISVKDV